MKLISLKYKLTTGSASNDWILEELNLNGINLVVGQNATGKSSIIRLITNFSQLIKNQTFTSLDNQMKVEWALVFIGNDGDIIKYELTIKDQMTVVKEYLSSNEVVLLDRSTTKSELYSSQQQKLVKIKPPENKLVLHIRRDIEEYPYFENLIKWAEGVSVFEFSKIRPLYMDSDSLLNSFIPYPNLLWKHLNEDSRKTIINDFNALGYQIEDIFLDKFNYRPDSDALYLMENGLENRLSEYQLSQGMFRALALIVYIQYVAEKNSVSMILIDDLGEGLDYERATKLGKLLVQKLENSNIQFIATSNDSFLMDVVPIKYWNILQRDGNTVRALNYQNSKEQFDEFKLSGLSNFYLFSSDFLTQKQD
jgi:AAA15 family ATPase/GTPase